MDLAEAQQLAEAVADELVRRSSSARESGAPSWVLAKTTWNRRWEHGPVHTTETTTRVYALHPDGRLIRLETVAIDRVESTADGLRDRSEPPRTTARPLTSADLQDLDHEIAFVSSRFSRPETWGSRFTDRRITELHGGGLELLLNRLLTRTH